jgi:hypothetical protein
MQSLLDPNQATRRLTLARPRARVDATSPRRSAARALLLCTALASTSFGLAACDEEDDPFGLGVNYVDAGSAGGTSGTGLMGGAVTGGGPVVGSPTGGGGIVPGDGGAPPLVGNDAGSVPALDAGGVSGGSGPLPEASVVPVGSPGGGGDPGRQDAATDASVNGGAEGGMLPPRADLGKGDGKDVIMIGDSWMSLGSTTSGIQGGVLKASGQPYRPYAIGGTTLLGGGLLDAFLSPIPAQYTQAKRENPNIKTVIMTAGGNDILQTGLQEDCKMMGDACAMQVTKILDGLTKLWAEMAADGVQDVVYIFYATPEGTSVDFQLPDGDGAKKRCANVPAPTRCHTVETVATVMGDIPDDIHPSQTASDRIGKVVVDLMAMKGMRR